MLLAQVQFDKPFVYLIFFNIILSDDAKPALTAADEKTCLNTSGTNNHSPESTNSSKQSNVVERTRSLGVEMLTKMVDVTTTVER